MTYWDWFTVIFLGVWAGNFANDVTSVLLGIWEEHTEQRDDQ